MKIDELIEFLETLKEKGADEVEFSVAITSSKHPHLRGFVSELSQIEHIHTVGDEAVLLLDAESNNDMEIEEDGMTKNREVNRSIRKEYRPVAYFHAGKTSVTPTGAMVTVTFDNIFTDRVLAEYFIDHDRELLFKDGEGWEKTGNLYLEDVGVYLGGFVALLNHNGNDVVAYIPKENVRITLFRRGKETDEEVDVMSFTDAILEAKPRKNKRSQDGEYSDSLRDSFTFPFEYVAYSIYTNETEMIPVSSSQ